MKNALICFTRVPRPGLTKTRLLPVLTPEQCAGLHWAFLRDLAQVYQAVDAHLFVAYTADENWEALKPVFPTARGFFPQEGADLGEKMYNAICRVLGLGYEAVVLTGADLPLLEPRHLLGGFSALENADLAMGPTSDGGYYLIGMKQPRKSVFAISGYGGSSVYERTVAAAKNAGLSVAPAPVCDDVDTPEDLRRLATQCAPDSFTGQYLQQLKQEGICL